MDDAAAVGVIKNIPGPPLPLPCDIERRTTKGLVGFVFKSPLHNTAALLGPSTITGGEHGVLAPLLGISLYDDGGGVRVGVLARPTDNIVSGFRGLWGGFCGFPARWIIGGRR